MATRYFDMLPSITYANKVSKNLMVSASFRDKVLDNPKAFVRHTLDEGESAEMTSLRFYGTTSYDWIIYFANNIIDPYHDWPKDYLTFVRFIEAKYGSTNVAKSQVVHYSNPKYDFTINKDTYDRYVDADFVDTTLKVDRDGWVPVYAYDFEEEKNDDLRHINIIHPDFITYIEGEVKELF